MPAPEVAVVVPVREAGRTLPALLAALGAQVDPPAFEVVLARDDAPGAGEAPGVAHGLTTKEVRVPDAPAGPGAARDAGVAATDARVVAFLDADCTPDPGWLAALVAPLLDGTADVVRGPLRLPPGAAQPGPFHRLVLQDAPDPFWRTANLAARRADVLAVGGFAGGVRPAGGKELGEDLVLGWRLVRAGARDAWAPEAVVRHPAEPRGWRAAAVERRRERWFCDLVGREPRLRTALLHRRLWLTPDHLRLHGALAGVALVGAGALHAGAAARTGRAARPHRARGARALLAAGGTALIAPYARSLAVRSRWWGLRRRPGIVLGLAAGDLAGAAALVHGSLRTQHVVL